MSESKDGRVGGLVGEWVGEWCLGPQASHTLLLLEEQHVLQLPGAQRASQASLHLHLGPKELR